MQYWDERFNREGKIWGDHPSPTVDIAINYFKKYHVNKILVPGRGYGRNTEAFAIAGFKVTGIDVSAIAHKMAVKSRKEKGFDIDYKHGDLLEFQFRKDKYEGVYCFNTLHFFTEEKRITFIDKVYQTLKCKGIIVFTVFSEKEPSFGKGKEIEPNTFESKRGRPAHYFTKKEVQNYFNNFEMLLNNIIKEQENHGTGRHTHLLRLIIAKKR